MRVIFVLSDSSLNKLNRQIRTRSIWPGLKATTGGTIGREPASAGSGGRMPSRFIAIALVLILTQACGAITPSPTSAPSALTTVAPTPTAAVPVTAATEQLTIVECGRFPQAICSQTIGVARQALSPEFAKPVAIAVDDPCSPRSICDRQYPFEAIVAFVLDPTAASRPAVRVFGKTGPERAEAWSQPLPPHIEALISKALAR